nr:MAG: RNA-dependent RNA polymerase [Botourmiaviridae sp.]
MAKISPNTYGVLSSLHDPAAGLCSAPGVASEGVSYPPVNLRCPLDKRGAGSATAVTIPEIRNCLSFGSDRQCAVTGLPVTGDTSAAGSAVGSLSENHARTHREPKRKERLFFPGDNESYRASRRLRDEKHERRRILHHHKTKQKKTECVADQGNPASVSDPVGYVGNVNSIPVKTSASNKRKDPSRNGKDVWCTLAPRLMGKASAAVRFFREELALEPVRDLPTLITCGDLKTAVRSVFPANIGPLAELSIKTATKLEGQCCEDCMIKFLHKSKDWQDKIFNPVGFEPETLSDFENHFSNNVRFGWNRHRSPVIPTGNASVFHSRKEGGSWNEENIEPFCRSSLVFSSGKPRVVTVYSSGYNETMSPLHNSLQKENERNGGWLLVGPPSGERISTLTGAGDYVSVDYSSATDNIKNVYQRRAVEVLKRKADPPLNPDEERCLEIFCHIRVAEIDNEKNVVDCTSAQNYRGQPMGSLMSFPLLCLINKTAVDMALTRIRREGLISASEWQSHRLLVNGDDLLTREPRRNGRQSNGKTYENELKKRLSEVGNEIGFVVNQEKTMTDSTKAEINSTLFQGGTLSRKSNVSALYMKPNVQDVLEFAVDASTSLQGFRRIVRANAHILAKQADKRMWRLNPAQKAICRKDRKIRRALCSSSYSESVRSPTNFFPVVEEPDGYSLTKDEEIACITQRVSKIRRSAVVKITEDRNDKRKEKRSIIKNARSFRSVIHEKKPVKGKTTILSCLARYWQEKERDTRVDEAYELQPYIGELPPSDEPSKIGHLVDAIRRFKAERTRACPRLIKSEFEDGSDWIRIESSSPR